MKKKVVQLVCDGCGTELEGEITRDPKSKREVINFPEGVSQIRVDVTGADEIRSLELCPDCTGQLPEGTGRKRPAPREKTAAAK